MSALVSQVLPWIAVAAILLCLGVASAVLTARSLFSACVGVAALSACAAAALLALGHGDGALAVALLGVGIAPVVLLGGVLLSGRSVKPRPRRLPWLSIASAAMAAVVMLWAAPTLNVDLPIASPRGGISVAPAALIFVAIVGCVALLGYGERGLLGGRDPRRDA